MNDPDVSRAAAAILVLLGAGSAACAPDEEPPVALEVLQEGVQMAAIDAEISTTREGVRRMRLVADTMEFLEGGEVRLHRMEMTFFELNGTEVSHITADGGTYEENTDDMEAVGSVVVLDRREDQRLETTRLRYVAEEDRLYGDEPFVLHKDGGRTEIRGSSFESDPEMTRVITYNSSGQSERVTPPAPPTSSLAPPDSTGPADSSGITAGAAAAAESVTVVPDSGSLVPDSLVSPVDTTGTAPDSSRIPPDSTGVPPDTTRMLRRG